MLAAVQAPIVLMSQNRQAEKDRLGAVLLHDKLDLLRQTQWQELLAMQKEQLALLAALPRQPPKEARPAP